MSFHSNNVRNLRNAFNEHASLLRKTKLFLTTATATATTVDVPEIENGQQPPVEYDIKFKIHSSLESLNLYQDFIKNY